MGVGNLAGCLSISFFLHSPSSTLILARILKTLLIKTQAQHNTHTLRHIHAHFFFLINFMWCLVSSPSLLYAKDILLCRPIEEWHACVHTPSLCVPACASLKNMQIAHSHECTQNVHNQRTVHMHVQMHLRRKIQRACGPCEALNLFFFFFSLFPKQKDTLKAN